MLGTADVGAPVLPLVLAGPVLRRVEPVRVVVWLATSVPARVRAGVWRVGGEDELLGAGTAESLQVGRRLFVHLAAAAPRAGAFPAGELLGYDVEVMPESGDGGGRLAELGMLDGAGAIAYPGLRLPTFVLAPGDDASLGVLHGSCRLLHGEGEDALLCADELLAGCARNVSRRPRALFLTGDQIYADDVAGPLVAHVRQMASQLMGPEDERSMPGCPPLSQVPVDGRRELAAERARLTGPKVDNHLLSFGEFAAMYVTAWNERTWPERLPAADQALAVGHSPAALRARSRLRACCSYLRLARSPRRELPASNACSAGGRRSGHVRSFHAVRYIAANSPKVRRWLSTFGPVSRARSAASSVRPPSGTCDSGGQPGIERSSAGPMSAVAICRTCPTNGPATSSA